MLVLLILFCISVNQVAAPPSKCPAPCDCVVRSSCKDVCKAGDDKSATLSKDVVCGRDALGSEMVCCKSTIAVFTTVTTPLPGGHVTIQHSPGSPQRDTQSHDSTPAVILMSTGNGHAQEVSSTAAPFMLTTPMVHSAVSFQQVPILAGLQQQVGAVPGGAVIMKDGSFHEITRLKNIGPFVSAGHLFGFQPMFIPSDFFQGTSHLPLVLGKFQELPKSTEVNKMASRASEEEEPMPTFPGLEGVMHAEQQSVDHKDGVQGRSMVFPGLQSHSGAELGVGGNLGLGFGVQHGVGLGFGSQHVGFQESEAEHFEHSSFQSSEHIVDNKFQSEGAFGQSHFQQVRPHFGTVGVNL